MKMGNEESTKWFNIVEILLDNLFIKLSVYTGLIISILMFSDSIILLQVADYSVVPLNRLIINFTGFLFFIMMIGNNFNNDYYNVFEIELKTKTENNIDLISKILMWLILVAFSINWIRVF